MHGYNAAVIHQLAVYHLSQYIPDHHVFNSRRSAYTHIEIAGSRIGPQQQLVATMFEYEMPPLKSTSLNL